MKNFIQDKVPLSISDRLTLFTLLSFFPAITRWFVQGIRVLLLIFCFGQFSFAALMANRIQPAPARSL